MGRGALGFVFLGAGLAVGATCWTGPALPAFGQERGAGEKVVRRWGVPLSISPLPILDRRVTLSTGHCHLW